MITELTFSRAITLCYVTRCYACYRGNAERQAPVHLVSGVPLAEGQALVWSGIQCLAEGQALGTGVPASSGHWACLVWSAWPQVWHSQFQSRTVCTLAWVRA